MKSVKDKYLVDGADFDKMIYRMEYPKPQFERKYWDNLNGEWEFAFDHAGTGEERGMQKENAQYFQKIIVPFSPESELSGIGYTDFINCVWYRRKIVITEQQMQGNIFLHFGAIDYIANVFVNGKKVGTHRGGYVSFKMEISGYVREGENTLVVQAIDDTRNFTYPSGKQAFNFQPAGCLYTRTTGIWQTVWLEYTPKTYIENVKYYPDVESQILNMQAQLVGEGTLTVIVDYQGKEMGRHAVHTTGGNIAISIPLKEKHLWELGRGRLYNVSLTYQKDEVKSYFGLRKIEYKDKKFYLNGKSVFQRLVLDQGYYPDGILTAPSDEALKADIDRAMGLGFNGARLHEKIFEERYLYHCDMAGYMVWAEYPSWGIDYMNCQAIASILPEWLEEVNRDFNHPSIIGWCPLNETENHMYKLTRDEIVHTIYLATKAVDNTRPCIDASGFYHVETDIFDDHDYEWDIDLLRDRYKDVDEGKHVFNPKFQQYKKGQHIFISELGGRSMHEGKSWGFPDESFTENEEYIKRLNDVVSFYLNHPDIFGICWTQLYDVEGEVNGFYTYHRQLKFEEKAIRDIFSKPAAVEKE